MEAAEIRSIIAGNKGFGRSPRSRYVARWPIARQQAFSVSASTPVRPIRPDSVSNSPQCARFVARERKHPLLVHAVPVRERTLLDVQSDDVIGLVYRVGPKIRDD